MKSSLGLMRHHTDKKTPYLSCSYKSTEEDEAMNQLMQYIIDVILRHPNETIVWRDFPGTELVIEEDCLGNPEMHYIAYARFALE